MYIYLDGVPNAMESKQCFLCENEAKDRCSYCMRPFCARHQSDFDTTLCTECVGFSNTHISGTHVLEDKDGSKLKEKARRIVLTGEGWLRNRDRINAMSDMELEAKIIALKEAVLEAEMISDFRKITLSQVENEKASRYSKRLSRIRLQEALRGKGLNSEAPSAPPSTSTQPPRSKSEQGAVAEDTIKNLMKAFGLTREKALAVIYQGMKAKTKLDENSGGKS